jgi:hypothetical protein
MLPSKSLLLLSALALACSTASAGTADEPLRREASVGAPIVSVAPVLLGTSVTMVASGNSPSGKMQFFSTELVGTSRWTVDAMRDGGHGATEIVLLRDDGVVRQTIRLGKDVVRQHDIRPAQRLTIAQTGKRSFELKRGKAVLSPLGYPQRGGAVKP